MFHILVQRRIIAERGCFIARGAILHEAHTVLIQPPAKLLLQLRLRKMTDIHLVDKDECRDMIQLQQLPYGLRMRLYAIRPADEHHGIVQYGKGAFHLRGKIDMARRIDERKFRPLPRQDRLLGKDGDAAAALLRIIVQKTVAMIHTAAFPDHPCAQQHAFAQRRLAGIDMRQQARTALFYIFFSALSAHIRSLLIPLSVS